MLFQQGLHILKRVAQLQSPVKWKNKNTATKNTAAAMPMIRKLSLAANDFL